MTSSNIFKIFAALGIDTGEYEDGLNDAENKGEKFSSKLASGLGKAVKVVGAAAATAATAAATGIAAISKSAIEEYANYEQLVGGVETLFGNQGMSLQEYAESQGKAISEVSKEWYSLEQAQTEVLANAKEAYKNAGLSTNEYMETVTSFSASLIASLDGDTKAAAEKADVAITDMSDNANKMGTSMEAIQNAYQGFAKQNYTMLDNLKLGYGGTKTEMQRLIEDAEKLSDTFTAQRDETGELTLGYADIVDAIHIVQDNMGITETTAEEAATTIQGSIGMMKSAWTNLLTGMADDQQDMGKLVDNLVESVLTVVDNIVPRIAQTVPRVIEGVKKLVTALLPHIPGIIKTLLPALMDAVVGLVNSVLEILPQVVQLLVEQLPAFIDGFLQIVNGIIEALPQMIEILVSALPVILPQLIDGVISLIVSLCNNISAIIMPIINALPDVIVSIVNALMDNLPALIQGATALVVALVAAIPQITLALIEAIPQIFISLVEGIIGAIPAFISSILQIFEGVWNSIKGFFTEIPSRIMKTFSNAGTWLIDAGKRIITGLWEGLKSMWKSVTNWFSNITNAIPKLKGPAEKDRHLLTKNGQLIMAGLQEGLEDGYSDVQDFLKGATVDIGGSYYTDFGVGSSTGGYGVGTGGYYNGGNNITMNIYGAEGQDVTELARLVSEQITFFNQQEAAVYG